MTKTMTLPDCCQIALKSQMRPDLFKALCDPVRISIVATLATRADPSSVTDIAESCGIDFSGVSRHLKCLKEAGILISNRDGRHVRYSLDGALLSGALRNMADALEVCLAQAR